MILPHGAVAKTPKVISVEVTKQNFKQVLSWIRDLSPLGSYIHESLSVPHTVIFDRNMASIGDYVVYDPLRKKFYALTKEMAELISF